MADTFRLSGKYFFVTYPKCPLEPQKGIPVFAKFKHYRCSVWGQERHLDGDLHLHAIVCMAERTNITSPTSFDISGENGSVYHGNYQVAREPRAVLDYVTKHGNVFEDHTTVAELAQELAPGARKRTATEVLLNEMKEGKTIQQAAAMHPEHLTFAMLHADRLTTFHNQTQLQEMKPPKTFLRMENTWSLPAADLDIARWMNSNLLNPTRVFGTKQLWLCGPTQHGKTTLVMSLQDAFRIYWVPDEDFYDDYCDASYDLIVFDEYRHQKTIQWMNRFVDGQICPLRQKGTQTVKRKNLPVIVLSNFRMREAYPNVEESHFNTLQRRFLEVWLERPLTTYPVFREDCVAPDGVSVRASGSQTLLTSSIELD